MIISYRLDVTTFFLLERMLGGRYTRQVLHSYNEEEVTWKMDGDPKPQLMNDVTQPHRTRTSLLEEGAIQFLRV